LGGKSGILCVYFDRPAGFNSESFKTTKTISKSREIVKLIIRMTAILAAILAVVNGGATAARAGIIQSGQVWLDTAGQPINAHGGGVLYYEGVYYWYGEAKSGRTYLPDCNQSWGGTRVDVSGVSCYSSTNLCDWRNEGLALTAVTNDPNHDLHPSRVVERPKVIYNRTTRKFVMWLHIDSANYAAARCGVAVSDRPTGPFQYLESFRPDAGAWPLNVTAADRVSGPHKALARDFQSGQMARDMTVFVDDDGQAYLFYSSEENPTMHVSRLTPDYLRTTGQYRRIFIGRSMEAPAVFKRDGKYYCIASGCTAWDPNAARSAVADHPLGPWTELGNPCTGKEAEITFHAQSTYVLPVAGTDQFIFMADQWKQWNLPDSRYLWLPLKFSPKGKPVVSWQSAWSPMELLTGAGKAAKETAAPAP
jgi:hypothetical protein